MAFFRINTSSAAPSGNAGGDLGGTYPNPTVISVADVTTGALPAINGGTGQSSYTDGQLLIGDSSNSGLDKATLTAGSNVTITNGHGSITISATSGSGATSAVQQMSGLSTATLTLVPSSYNNENFYLNGQSSTNQNSLIMTFNSDTTSSHYTISTLTSTDNSGSNTLTFSNGLRLAWDSGSGSSIKQNTNYLYLVVLTVSGGTTSWTISGFYQTQSQGLAFVSGNGTFNAATTTVTITSSNNQASTLAELKVS